MKKSNTFVVRGITLLLLVMLVAGNFITVRFSQSGNSSFFSTNSHGSGNRIGQSFLNNRALTGELPAGYRDELEQILNTPTDDNYTEEEAAAIRKFYAETAFVGDSLMMGYNIYLQKNDREGYFAKTTMLCAYGFSARDAIRPIGEKTKHPLYKGKKMLVEDALKLAKSKRVFIVFWANEIPGADIGKANQNLEILVQRIREKSPDIEVYIVSPCYLYLKTPKKTNFLNNNNLYALTLSRREFCKNNNAGYVEVSKYLGNEKVGLLEKYTSDYHIHVNKDAYDIWTKVFTDYALGRDPDIEVVPK